MSFLFSAQGFLIINCQIKVYMSMEMESYSPQQIKQICSQYTRFMDESSQIQLVLSSFVSSLKTSLMLLPNEIASNCSFENREMEMVKVKVQGVIGGIRGRLEDDVGVVSEVNRYVDKIGVEFKRLIELTKFESDRSATHMMLLENQLKLKDQDISDCQNVIEADKMKKLEEEWKKQQYVGYKGYVSENGSEPYLNILKEFRNKVQLQFNFEKEEMLSIMNNIVKKFKEFKMKLLQTWNLLCCYDKSKTSHLAFLQTKNAEKYTDLQRQYMNKEKKVDGFEFSQLNEIKKKLRLLEEADISESHEYFSYSESHSRERQVDESVVMNLFM